MKFYLALQVKRLERKLTEIGIQPILGYVLLLLGFLSLSKYLFYKTEFAVWIYGVVAVSSVLRLGDVKRNDLLRAIFRKKEFYQIRLLENVIVASPFFLYLLYEGRYLMSLLLLPLSLLAVLANFRQSFFMTIPTPFRKFPFEFIVGFRKSLPFFLLAGFLLYKGIEIANFNLALFSLGLVFLMSMSFYLEPEALYFVWIFNSDASSFLRQKMLHALMCVSILSLPFLLLLCFYFPDKIWIMAITQFVGYGMLIAMLLAKYSAFPDTMSIPQGIFFALSLWFPPMLLITIPVFYAQSKKRLKPILEW